MGSEGFEPSLLTDPDFKSGAAADYATSPNPELAPPYAALAASTK